MVNKGLSFYSLPVILSIRKETGSKKNNGIHAWYICCVEALQCQTQMIIHIEAYIGQPKVKSAAAATCRSVNSSIEVVEHEEALRTSNALEIFSKYDIIVDATDNAPTLYDQAFPVLLYLYVHSQMHSVIPGIIGCLQALEAIKIAASVGLWKDASL
ncbi:adenylyltransferase and sulfurtransferase MOCS3 [Trifolium repens]|nr:adenylyltransferase and sulfurtransferase MOCS3 [Trifolium repens]